MDKLHAAIRRELCASNTLKHWERQYRENPSDELARLYHAAWIEMRASVDALVAIEAEPDEQIGLAG